MVNGKIIYYLSSGLIENIIAFEAGLFGLK